LPSGATMEEAAAIKEEDPQETSPPDPFQVPPSDVLDKLGLLLKSGKALLRYSHTGEVGWGLNGKVADRWCSFSAEVDGVCRFEDELALVTESAQVWASLELEKLKRLAQEASQLPSTNAPQPGAHRAKDCRRAVFDFHRAEHVKRRRARLRQRQLQQGLQGSPAKSTAATSPANTRPLTPGPAAMAAEMLPPAKAAAAANSGALLAAAKAAVVIRKAPSAKVAGGVGVTRAPPPPPPAPPMPKLVTRPATAAAGAPSVRSWNDVAHQATPPASGAPYQESQSDGATAETEPRMSATFGKEPVEKQHEANVSMPFRLVVYFMRGPPGCGKSTAARRILARHLSAQGIRLTPQASKAAFLPIYRAFIHSTNDFSMKFTETGDAEYQYNPAFLQENHARNRVRTEAAMRLCLTPLIIDNTNIELWEMRDYIKLADQFHYEVRIIDPLSLDSEALNPDHLFARCQQATPDRPRGKHIGHDVFKRMSQNFEPMPGGESSLEAIRTAKRRRRELEKPTIEHVEEPPAPEAPQAMAGTRTPATGCEVMATARDAPARETVENGLPVATFPLRPPAKVPITKKPSTFAKPPQFAAGQLILTTKATGSKAPPALKMPMAKKKLRCKPTRKIDIAGGSRKSAESRWQESWKGIKIAAGDRKSGQGFEETIGVGGQSCSQRAWQRQSCARTRDFAESRSCRNSCSSKSNHFASDSSCTQS